MVIVTVRDGYVCVDGRVVEGYVRRYFLHNRGGLEVIFFVLEEGVLSKFLLDNSSFSAATLDNYCSVPKC